MNEIPVVSLQHVHKSFRMTNGAVMEVLSDINLNVDQNEFVALLGYSGCGKTTLLRVLCGFEKADSGYILVDGQPLRKPNKKVLMLFQDFNQLMPWKTVLANVMFPLLATKAVKSKQEARGRAEKRIDDVGLSAFAHSYPHQLSGGMKQRVAVARALALQPRVLLMDEPFAALDNITRGTLQVLTRRVCEKYGVTTIFVTHSVEEAALLADRIVVMKEKPGRIERIFDNPGRANPMPEERLALTTAIMALLDSFRKPLRPGEMAGAETPATCPAE